MTDSRVGIGFDSHPRDPGRPLRLGGVGFPDEPGLSGHSDGDVVCHALADALLGASALGDIGRHFPEGNPGLADIAGLELLRRTIELVKASGFLPERCDLTVIAERPHLDDRRDEVRASLAQALGVRIGEVSVKATRPEGLGLTGDGIGCMALVTIRPG
ncbi:MAG: 2-C-methyl-D-erythritol 2,4-cyclodiphosphate synthase [Actinomycetota bacterium]